MYTDIGSDIDIIQRLEGMEISWVEVLTPPHTHDSDRSRGGAHADNGGKYGRPLLLEISDEIWFDIIVFQLLYIKYITKFVSDVGF